MLLTIAVILVILWALGLAHCYTLSDSFTFCWFSR